uniref:Uncharacterized protein n=1 Tax=Ignavibacterium album TaxID=591197 RepID=A0A832G8A0_9BACT
MSIDKLSLYDFIAVLMPGIFFLICTEMIFNLASSELVIPEGNNLPLLLLLIVFGYITGILLQGLSQTITDRILKLFWKGQLSEKWLMDNNQFLSDDYKKIFWEKVKLKLNRSKPTGNEQGIRKNNREIFSLIVKLVEREKYSDKIQIFIAQFSFFRSLLTVFSILLSFLVFKYFSYGNFTRIEIMILVFSLIGLLISYSGVKKRNEDFVRATLDAFII